MQRTKQSPGTFPLVVECASTGRGLSFKLTVGSYWSFKMLSTFLDLWKQWQGGKSEHNIEQGGKECQPDAKVLSMHGQHHSAIHTVGLWNTALRTCQGHSSR